MVDDCVGIASQVRMMSLAVYSKVMIAAGVGLGAVLAVGRFSKSSRSIAAGVGF